MKESTGKGLEALEIKEMIFRLFPPEMNAADNAIEEIIKTVLSGPEIVIRYRTPIEPMPAPRRSAP